MLGLRQSQCLVLALSRKLAERHAELLVAFPNDKFVSFKADELCPDCFPGGIRPGMNRVLCAAPVR